jgi:predicted transposase/invertase (TIGR01784 family)
MQKGIQEGMQKGIQKGIYTVARNMKQMGISIADIAKATGLSEEEINIL